eukprot:Nk52_evm48s2367 gene=Nk52_evmTU48s2367
MTGSVTTDTTASDIDYKYTTMEGDSDLTTTEVSLSPNVEEEVRHEPAGVVDLPQHPIEISVTEPEKTGDGMNAHITYKINVKTTMVDFEKSEFSVRRRYQDFDFLREKLQKNFENCVIPPMPGKQVKQRLNRFSDEFTEKRRYNLERFLRRIAKHDTLRQSKLFILFLQGDNWDAEKGRTESGILNDANSSLSSASGKAKNPDERFTTQRNNLKQFEDYIMTLDGVNKKMKAKKEEMETLLNEVGPLFTHMSNMEDDLSSSLTMVGQHFTNLAVDLKRANDADEQLYVEPVHEYAQYCEEARNLLKKREGVEHAFESAQDHLTKKEQERDSVENQESVKSLSTLFGKKTGQVAKEEKLEKLATQIQKAEEDLAEKEKVLNDVNVLVMEEITFFEKNRVIDFKSILLEYSKAQKAFHEKSASLWGELTERLESELSS